MSRLLHAAFGFGVRRARTIDGGFLSVAHNEVRLLCEHAEISHESNYDEAKRLLEEAKARSEATG